MHEATVVPLLSLNVSRFVEEVRACAAIEGRSRRVDRLPDGRTGLTFRVLEDGTGDLTVVGPRTRAHLKDAVGFLRAVTLELKPGWSTPILGVPASLLVDRFIPLEEVWGASARLLCNELLAARSVTDVVTRLSRTLAARLSRKEEPASAWLARQAVRLLAKDGARVEDVAGRVGVTARHLRRAFVENVGVGPKEFARSARLHRALRMASTSGDWARIAADSGYYDQAHLIGDFRDLVGMTPGAYVRRASETNPVRAPRS